MVTNRPNLPTKRRAKRSVGITAGLLACVGLAAAPGTAMASAIVPSHPTSSSPRVIASGLDNPRQLSFGPGGALYVAESGHGGSGPCIASDDDPTVDTCFGTSGAIAMVRHGKVSQVVSGLPSLAPQVPTQGGQLPPGAEAVGPSDVVVHGRTVSFTVGLGSNPTNRFTFSAASSVGHLLSTVDTATTSPLGHLFGLNPMVQQRGDLAAFEAVNNPAPPADGPDSNANALLRDGGGYVVADAGGNDLLSVSRSGKVSLITTFPNSTTMCQPEPNVPPQAVPTSVVRGPDGAYYVSELTGFPFCEGGAVIWKVKNGKASVYASGLTNVTDLAFGHGGMLYAVEIAQHGLLKGPIGAVVAIPRGGGSSHSVVAAGLMAPYGIALRGNTAYVTTGSILPKSAGGGQVVAIRLPGHGH